MKRMIWLAISVTVPPYRSFRTAAPAIGALLIVLALLPGPSGLATGRSEPCTSSKTCRDVLALATGRHIPYYRSLPLALNENVRRAVVVVQGADRHADRYYDRLVAAARAEAGSSTRRSLPRTSAPPRTIPNRESTTGAPEAGRSGTSRATRRRTGAPAPSWS